MMYVYSFSTKKSLIVVIAAFAAVMNGHRAQAQLSPAGPGGPGWVLSHQKISDTEGGFTGDLDNFDWFGASVASLGDLDGDGVGDLAVGAVRDDDGGNERGAVWVLFLGSCPWDLDNSGSVGTGDLLELFAQWGTDGPADFDGSGAVGTADLLILFANWGPCP